MNKTISKLTTFLRDLFIDTLPICKVDTILGTNESITVTTVIGTMILWLENEELFAKHNVVSDDFSELVAILEILKTSEDTQIRFKDSQLTNIVMYFIRKNIDNKILDESLTYTPLMDASKFVNKTPSIEDLLLISMQKDNFESYKCLYKKYLSLIEPKPNEIHVLSNLYTDRIESMRNSHRIIKEHYFDKINTFTEEDIEIIINALNMMGDIKSIEESIRTTLLKQINCRTAPKPKIEIKKVERVYKPILTKKEYHKIKNELDSKFDFERMEPRIDVTLTPEEIEYCLNLMNQLSFTDREKEIFLEKSFKKTREELLNIDSIMSLLQNQIEFYNISSETVNKAMENLELYIEEYKSTEDLIEKEEWLELIKEEIIIVNAFIPKKFEYEKAMLLKKKVN